MVKDNYRFIATAEEVKFQPPIGTSSRKPYVQLETDAKGNPLLPEPTEWPSKGMDKKALIRSYVGSAYCQCQKLFFLSDPDGFVRTGLW